MIEFVLRSFLYVKKAYSVHALTKTVTGKTAPQKSVYHVVIELLHNHVTKSIKHEATKVLLFSQNGC